MTVPLFEIDDLHVSTPAIDGGGPVQGAGVEILKGVSLTINSGEVHALMGPNGSGKSTLAASLLGSPGYEVTSGRIIFRGDDITYWGPDVRSKAGVFLAFQHPQEIAGVSLLNLLQQALSARKGIEMSVLELRATMTDWMEKLGMDSSHTERSINEGFSGGEKKLNELLQMAVLEPEIAILDETDSDLDIEAGVAVARGVHTVRAERSDLGILAITHYQRLLDHLKPDHVHVLDEGRIVASGGPELAKQVEQDGYESFR